MKRVPILMLLIMAFVSFATMDSFDDSSPPGAEISINYELPQGIELNFESQDAHEWLALQRNLLNTGEARIAVNDCDLKFWPGNENSIYTLNNIARVNYAYDDALYWTTELETSLYTKNSLTIKDGYCNQYRLFVDKIEVLSLYEHSKGARHSARNEVT